MSIHDPRPRQWLCRRHLNRIRRLALVSLFDPTGRRARSYFGRTLPVLAEADLCPKCLARRSRILAPTVRGEN